MSKRKILALALTLSMVAILAVGGTLAYFMDTDMKTNTMKIGNIDIAIQEWQYGANGWEEYKDDTFVLYPVESEQGNALFNKSVRTFNTSTSGDAAYIRSIILVEKNTELTASYVNEGDCCFPGIHLNYDAYDGVSYTYTSSKDSSKQHASKEAGHLEKTVEIDGKEYWVIWYVAADEKAIPVNEALSSLGSVWMDKNVSSDNIDGWGTDGVQILVFSQGIQAEGLTHAEAMDALGEVTVESVEGWLAE